jgi:hypothetical protein
MARVSTSARRSVTPCWRSADGTFDMLGRRSHHAAERELRGKYPKIPDEAVRALAWCFGYDWK